MLEMLTIGCYRKQPLLLRSEHKQIILDSLKFLVSEERIHLFGFVIMPTYMVIIWQKRGEWANKNVQQMFLKYTAQQIKHFLKTGRHKELEQYKSTRNDRKYQFWARNSSLKVIETLGEAYDELAFMHHAPSNVLVRRGPHHYPYSSARFYHTNIDKWLMLSNIASYDFEGAVLSK